MRDQSSNIGNDPSVEVQQGYWDERWESQRSPNDWQNQRAEAILALLRSRSLDSARILDLGCATSWMTSRLAEFGTVGGVDLSETAIAIARSRPPVIQFTSGDLYEIPLTSEPVDVVVCREVIVHVSDPQGLVEGIDNRVKPGGYLVISAANKIVMDRVRSSDGIVGVGPEDPDEHIKKWLGMRDLKLLVKPHFEILRSTSVIPLGNRGLLRIVNSPKLNRVLASFLTVRRVEALKERLGFGYSIIVLGQKLP